MKNRDAIRGNSQARVKPITLILALTSVVLLSFNNCSDVAFSNNTGAGSTVNGEGTGGTGGGGNTPADPPKPPVINSYVYDGLVPPLTSKADLFFVLDNSGSMQAELAKLAERMDGLLATLDAAGIDWQMCFTTTDAGAQRGVAQFWQQKLANGSFAPTNRKVIFKTDADKTRLYSDTMASILTVYSSSSTRNNEQGIKSGYLAITNAANANCFRPDAALSMILISDEDEASTGTRDGRILPVENRPSNFQAAANMVFPNKAVFYHSIVWKPGDQTCDPKNGGSGQFEGFQYAALTNLTGGILGNVCATSYADQLVNIGTRTTEGLKSVSLKCAPYGTPTVAQTPATGIGYRIEGNKVIFNTALPPGTRILVNYQCAE